SNDLVVEPRAEKGIILNSRILWTFSRAFQVYGDTSHLQLARRAFDYINEHFNDREFGGVFWTVDYLGRPCDTKKRTYGQAFILYALSEYHRATRSAEALNAAHLIFNLLENRTRDPVNGGYFETFNRDWSLAADQRLSEVDQDDKKSMNTHLHVLEAYASLARTLGVSAAAEAGVTRALRDVVDLFAGRILDPHSAHFRLFFDEAWNVRSNHVSFGHDIEGSWLLYEAAEILGDPQELERVNSLSVKMAQAVYREAVDADGALLYEADASGIVDYDKHWWAQAEAVVGFLNAYQLTAEADFLTAALRCWEFINSRLIDKKHGEWFWKVSRDGKPDDSKPKVDQWKCPYHNGRMCFEVLERLDSLKDRML
ncbi:MAG TPA: AGE family epimerase/isomerase, partial [Blastocatellia bacterium]|nr:AGE family epimerase/isomerase [Blastocatellia bacterium]